MTNEAVNLLRRLGSGVIPGAASSQAIGAPIEGMDFPTLLVGADRGLIRTGRTVLIGGDLESPLSMDQLRNIADAIDLAETTGVMTVLVLIDRRALAVDVRLRKVNAEVSLDIPAQAPVDVLLDIEAAVVAMNTVVFEETEESDETSQIIPTRRHVADLAQIQNRSVAELLAGDPLQRSAG